VLFRSALPVASRRVALGLEGLFPLAGRAA